ncbi:glycosyl transferase family 2 [Pseudomonas aeruginosa]|nr:glycosyl transferase family 2 [Pseudomonas aeruginosa]
MQAMGIPAHLLGP